MIFYASAVVINKIYHINWVRILIYILGGNGVIRFYDNRSDKLHFFGFICSNSLRYRHLFLTYNRSLCL